jgi:hypothetical protein
MRIDSAARIQQGDDTHLLGSRLEGPLLGAVKRVDVDTARNVDVLGHGRNDLQRTLNSVENGLKDAGAELHGEGLAGAEHWVADSQTRCLLVHLRNEIRVTNNKLTNLRAEHKPEWWPGRPQDE